MKWKCITLLHNAVLLVVNTGGIHNICSLFSRNWLWMQEAFTGGCECRRHSQHMFFIFTEFFNFLLIIIIIGCECNSFHIFQQIHSIQTQNIHLNWESITSIFLIDIIHNFRDICLFFPFKQMTESSKIFNFHTFSCIFKAHLIIHTSTLKLHSNC